MKGCLKVHIKLPLMVQKSYHLSCWHTSGQKPLNSLLSFQEYGGFDDLAPHIQSLVISSGPYTNKTIMVVRDDDGGKRKATSDTKTAAKPDSSEKTTKRRRLHSGPETVSSVREDRKSNGEVKEEENDEGETSMGFGKYAHRTYRYVATHKPGYCEWALTLENPSTDMRAFLVWLLESELLSWKEVNTILERR